MTAGGRFEGHAQAVCPAFARLRQARGLQFQIILGRLRAAGDVLNLQLLVPRQADLVDHRQPFLRIQRQRGDAHVILPGKDVRAWRIRFDQQQRGALLHRHRAHPRITLRQPHAEPHGQPQGGGSGGGPVPAHAPGGQRLPAQVQDHLMGAGVAVLGLRRTGGADHTVQALPVIQLVPGITAGGDVWKVQAVLSRAGLIQHHAQGKDV